ncbi:unnamed protein product [Paramecium pentaurelia]|uniref:Tetratricopeptide repeat protein n=1 Tax=Paramecium pentaurelia TaxID=43138 RepID=A0A8S1XZW5_9CILI|nr:unnamed protein product [Paramecium pentaurelia]
MERFCLNPEHQNKQIIGYCVQELCRKQTRALCMKCMTGQAHSGHKIIEQTEEEDFFREPNLIYTDLIAKLNLIKRQFTQGISFLERILEKHYRPIPLNNIGNQEVDNKINCILKLDKVQKLVNDRIDNIFEHTLKSIKLTYQDLTIGTEFQCYEQTQKQNYKEALPLIEQCLLLDSKNTILKLAKAEIYSNTNKVLEARQIYEQILQTEDANPWAFLEFHKLLNQQERR